MVKLLNTVLFFFLFTTTQAQIAVMMANKSDNTAPTHTATQNHITSAVSSSNVANSYSTLEYIEKIYTPEILKSEVRQTTYTNLTQLAKDPKSNYLHPQTKTIFPYNLGEFERKQVFEYSKEPGKLSVIYTDKSGKSFIEVHLTPTHDAREGRLRNEYLKEIKKLAKEEGKNYLPKPQIVKFNGRNYTNNGVSGTYREENTISQYTLYECGVWLLGMNMKMHDVDSADFEKMTEELTRQFNPSRYTALSPLNLKSNVDFNKEALKDTVVTSALVSSAFAKMNWATDNVSSRERHSGFPDIYLAMHLAAFDEYLKIQGRKKSLNASPAAKEFYYDILALRNAGFLAEYIMEQYEEVMIVPPYLKLNFDAYRQWRSRIDIQTKLNQNRYTIVYRNVPY